MDDLKTLKKKYLTLLRKQIALTHKYNVLLNTAEELNKQVKEYRALTNKVVGLCNAQLNTTETYDLGSPLKLKED